MHWSNQFIDVNLPKNEPKTLLDLHRTYVLERPMAQASQGKGRSGFQTLLSLSVFSSLADSKPCVPYGVPYDANLTVPFPAFLETEKSVTTINLRTVGNLRCT